MSCTAPSYMSLPTRHHPDPHRRSTALPRMYQETTKQPPLQHSYKLNMKPMSPKPAQSNEGKAALKHILLTPPSSTELPRQDSFSSEKDDHGHRDHALFPSGSRSSSQDSDLPLFNPISSKRPSMKHVDELHSNPSPPRKDDLTRPVSKAGLDDLTAQHRVAFAAQHPSIAPPSERDYQLFANFSMDIRERASDHSPEQRGRITLPPISTIHAQTRPMMPQYAPWYSTSPQMAPGRDPSHRRRSIEEFPKDQTPSPRKRRLSPVPRVQGDDRAATVPATSKRQRSTTGSKSRSRASTGSLSKEAKHNRNRSTKQRYSTNYRDYPDYSPPNTAMINPMSVAEQVIEHKVNNRKDLTNDEHRPQLHPAEVVVATRLNISCGEYLLTKRQVLNEFVEYLRGDRKKAWNKTRAQSSSNLDVGKTSQIWTFFKDVGWFDESLYEKAVRG